MITFYRRKCVAALLGCFFLQATYVCAQPQLTLRALVEASQQHLPLLKQKQSLLNGAEASVTDVRHSFLPQVRMAEQLNIGSNNSLAGSLFTYGITPSSSAGIRGDNVWQPATGNVAVVYGEYELYNFGLNNAKLGYAQSVVNLQRADLNRDQYQVAAEVVRLYLSILKYQYRLEADRQNIQRYDTIFTIIRALTSSGFKAGADSSIARAELSRTRMNYNQAEGTLQQLREQLSYLTGIAPGELRIDSLPRQFEAQTLFPQFALDTTINPLLDVYRKRQDIFRQNETLIRKSFQPKLLLSASTWARGSSIQYNDQFKALTTGLGYQRFNYLAGITLTYNLLNGLYKKDKLAVNRFQSLASNYEFEQQQQLLSSSARRADNNLNMIAANLRELPVQLQSAQAGYLQKLAQYKAGLISLIDLTNATFVLYRSQTDQVEALSDWYLAQLDKAATTGNLNTFIQSLNP